MMKDSARLVPDVEIAVRNRERTNTKSMPKFIACETQTQADGNPAPGAVIEMTPQLLEHLRQRLAVMMQLRESSPVVEISFYDLSATFVSNVDRVDAFKRMECGAIPKREIVATDADRMVVTACGDVYWRATTKNEAMVIETPSYPIVELLEHAQ